MTNNICILKCYPIIILQVYVFEKADIPEDSTELERFVGALMEYGVSLSTYKEMIQPPL